MRKLVRRAKDKADEGGTKTRLEISNVLCRRYMEMRSEEMDSREIQRGYF